MVGDCCGRHSSISIHALREEGDLIDVVHHQLVIRISIHALREEGDGLLFTAIMSATLFLSTPSARRATAAAAHPRSWNAKISIHALREEGDGEDDNRPQTFVAISIHALREEGDPGCWCRDSLHTNFYPRPPRGGRLLVCGFVSR